MEVLDKLPVVRKRGRPYGTSNADIRRKWQEDALERERKEAAIAEENAKSSHTAAVWRPKLEILPHHHAPLFAYADADLVLGQALSAITSQNGFSTSNAALREVLRQAGFVSMWFFLKVICGYNGPYSRLTDHIHVDMCNFYQNMMVDGRWSAAFLPRSTYKTTVFTHGGNTWELLRDPDITIGMGSSITDRAMDFKLQTQRNFDSNELFAWLYPEYVPGNARTRAGSWNDKHMVMPNRTRRIVSDSIEVLAVGASTQGIHVRVLKLDDIVGDAQLKADRSANSDMVRIKNWFESNIRTLVDNPAEDRVFLCGTRYGVDDPYEAVMDNIVAKYGYWADIPKEVSSEGMWHVYNRQAEEFSESTFPERMSIERLAEIRETTPWTYWTQYQNNPYSVESAELSEYKVKGATVGAHPYTGKMSVMLEDGRTYPLSVCDVVLGADPAATERNIATSRTSRSAVVVLLRTPRDDRVVLDLRADYVKLSKLFDWLFALNSVWKYRVGGLEMQGPFKILKSALDDEQARRKEWLPIRAVKAEGDKVARIRAAFEPILRAGLLYVTPPVYPLIMGELQGFPTMSQKDILDAFTIADSLSFKPADQDELDDDEDMVTQRATTASSYTGY